jgi:hypothetical protein
MYQLDVDEVGPSLRFATVQVRKATRARAGDGFTPADAPDDPWSDAIPADQYRQQTATGPTDPATPVARAA